jgi:hypothetical protein
MSVGRLNCTWLPLLLTVLCDVTLLRCTLLQRSTWGCCRTHTKSTPIRTTDKNCNAILVQRTKSLAPRSSLLSASELMAPPDLPSFRPLDLAKSSDRLASSQWRTFVAVLDTDQSNEASGVLTRVQEMFNNKLTPRERGRFNVVTREALVEHTKRRKLGAGKLPEALADLIAQDKVEGLAAKKRQQLQSRSGRDDPSADDSTTSDAARQKLELRAAVLCGAENNADSAPDRIYLLVGFPANESEATQLLEHGVSTAAKLSAAVNLFDAVVQLTAHTAASATGASTAEHSAASTSTTASLSATIIQQLAAAQSKGGTLWQDVVFKPISVTHYPAAALPQSTLEQGKLQFQLLLLHSDATAMYRFTLVLTASAIQCS